MGLSNLATTTIVLCLAAAAASLAAPDTKPRPVVIQNNDPHIYFHGRWDKSPGTWWAGSGFKLHAENLHSLRLNLGPHTTTPSASIGVSVDYQPFFQVNVSAGANDIPLGLSEVNDTTQKHKPRTVVRINAQGWQNNRVNLETIQLNHGAKLLPYTPSKLSFHFIGDSLSAGQFLPQGVDQAWPFLTGEAFKAEHTVIAQPGAALTDIVSYGNQHGLSYIFFRTEDDGYYYTADHNYTTPWNFARDVPAATHLVIHIGANDASHNIISDAFVKTYLTFVARLRTIYHKQPIFVFTPWGWPNADGTVGQYLQGSYQKIVNARHALGDRNVFLVDTTGWVTFADVFPDNQHPNVPGHQKIANLFEAWLKDWGLSPETHWST
ncbi:SGNH hydrolase-type esterase domain-containing protein [Cristinia sonorae]|uniref:SGNH hydrolase-type esterase domain-containing protein n=1 Tax=Cristinia sonorae TaxID=1940300 RepID=A0A8K0UIH3_9AGAR|nr:SGNH hydrolase-type esterase domain-containing protein [Cristinia sonorae]